MTLSSPIVAMLWETWRLTRVEAAWKLALGVALTLAALIFSAVFAPLESAEWYEDIKDTGARIARVLLFMPHIVGWLSLAALNAGKPGFPLYLHYTRPIRTAVMVGLPTAYLTAVSFAIYLVSAFLLKVTSGYPYSVLPAAAWIAAFALVLGAISWSTRSRVVLMLGSMVTLLAGGSFVGARLDSFPNDVDYPLTDYAVIALIGLISFGITVASVARQRRGDAQTASTPVGGLWGWLIDLSRFPCPTSSATRAQLWLDLKSSGLPVLTIGVVLATVILLVSAVGNPIDAAFQDEIRAHLSCSNTDCFYVRAWPVFLTPLSLLVVLFLARNAFGIRSKQGRTYVSAFEATQACGTAQLAALKVLVTSGCVLAAIIAIGVSVWISVPLLGDAVFIQVWNVPLSSRLPAINGAIAALTGYEQLSLVFVASVGVVIWVAAFAVFGALRTRYARRVNIASSLLLLYGLAFVLRAPAGQGGNGWEVLVMDALFGATPWIAVAAIMLATVYVSWRAFAERLLTLRQAAGAVLVSAACGAAWVTVLRAAGVSLSGMPATDVVRMLSPALLPLLASVVAPWSLSRIRHT